MAKGLTSNADAQRSVTRSRIRQMIKQNTRSLAESHILQTGTSGSTATAGVVTGITSNIVQGDGLSDRTGSKITVNRINAYFHTTIHASAITDRVRLIVFSDTQNSNATPSVADVLTAASVSSYQNPANEIANRFRIYYDKTHQLNTAGSAGTQTSFTMKCGDYPVYYSSSTGSGRNNIYYLLISDTATTVASFTINFEVRFLDF